MRWSGLNKVGARLFRRQCFYTNKNRVSISALSHLGVGKSKIWRYFE